MRNLCLAILLLSVSASVSAGETPSSGRATRPRRGPALSPEVDSQRRVSFRLEVSGAGEVSVAGQWENGNVEMTKNPDGDVWSVTTEPVEPGVWEYSLVVDGFRMIDPGNPAIKPMRQPRTSILHIPGDPPLVHDYQDVPHGTVRLHTYRSKSLGRLRNLAVYTPPGYEHHPDLRYPLLVLQHGSGDNHETWTVHGKAHWILDNLLAAGKARPMIVVMLDGHAAERNRNAAGYDSNTEAFEHDLLEDVLPWVEVAYRVKPGSENRGIVGLSMGGGQSLTIGLNHADQFAWVGGFSSSAPSEQAIAPALADGAGMNAKLKLLWIACGRSDFLLERNQAFIALLEEKGLKHEWHLTDGNHSWPIWRGYLADFAPRLFQD